MIESYARTDEHEVLIVDLSNVSMVDVTGIYALEDLIKNSLKKNTEVFISEVDGNTGTDLQDNYTFSWVASDGTDVTPASNTNVPSSLIGDTYTVTVTSVITGCTVEKDYVIRDNAIYPSLDVVQIRPNTACVINQGTGMHFDGSNDYIALPQQYNTPLNSFTAECWFKTTDNRGKWHANWALIDLSLIHI